MISHFLYINWRIIGHANGIQVLYAVAILVSLLISLKLIELWIKRNKGSSSD
jgi:hypothetical protein